MEAWLLYFLEGVCSQAEHAGLRNERLEELRTAYRERFAADRSRKALAALVDYLIGSPITSISQARKSLKNGSFAMIRRNIEKLEALGIVCKATGRSRNRVFYAEDILNILEDRPGSGS